MKLSTYFRRLQRRLRQEPLERQNQRATERSNGPASRGRDIEKENNEHDADSSQNSNPLWPSRPDGVGYSGATQSDGTGAWAYSTRNDMCQETVTIWLPVDWLTFSGPILQQRARKRLGNGLME